MMDAAYAAVASSDLGDMIAYPGLRAFVGSKWGGWSDCLSARVFARYRPRGPLALSWPPQRLRRLHPHSSRQLSLRQLCLLRVSLGLLPFFPGSARSFCRLPVAKDCLAGRSPPKHDIPLAV